MSNIKIFENKEFGQVRTVEVEGVVLFSGTDVATILGYANPQKAIRDHCKGVNELDTPTTGGIQKIKYIKEPDLYRLIIKSNLPNAEKFEKWVMEEVLPSIRKHGGYIAGQEEMTPEELMARALQYADSKIKEMQGRIQRQEVEISHLSVKNEILAPKAEYFDVLVDRNLLTSFRDTAKEFGIGEKKFIQFLLDKKYVYRDKKGKLTPYANEKTDGLFDIKECYNEKTQWAGVQTRITPKGRETFRLLTQGL